MDLAPVAAMDFLSFIQEGLFVYGVGVIFVVLVLLFLIIHHLNCLNKPKERLSIILMLLVPSIYSIVAYVGLRSTHRGDTFFMVLDVIKECYAALVIGMFLRLLYTYLNIDIENLSPRDPVMITKGRVICNFFPVTLIQPRYVRLTLNKLKFVKYFIWQFLVVRLVCSLLMIVLKLLDIYPIWLKWAFFVILSSSVSLAYYTLFVFYKAYYKYLPSYTGDKFFCVKGIIFVCFWQGGVLRILDAMGIIKSNHFCKQELQNNLVMLEMMFLAVFQMVAYGPEIEAAHSPILPIQQPAPKLELAESRKKSLPSCVNV